MFEQRRRQIQNDLNQAVQAYMTALAENGANFAISVYVGHGDKPASTAEGCGILSTHTRSIAMDRSKWAWDMYRAAKNRTCYSIASDLSCHSQGYNITLQTYLQNMNPYNHTWWELSSGEIPLSEPCTIPSGTLSFYPIGRAGHDGNLGYYPEESGRVWMHKIFDEYLPNLKDALQSFTGNQSLTQHLAATLPTNFTNSNIYVDNGHVGWEHEARSHYPIHDYPMFALTSRHYWEYLFKHQQMNHYSCEPEDVWDTYWHFQDDCSCMEQAYVFSENTGFSHTCSASPQDFIRSPGNPDGLVIIPLSKEEVGERHLHELIAQLVPLSY